MELEFSGERLTTSIFSESAVEHLHRYCFAFEIVKGKTVLDIACGEGYGSFLLSDYSEKVIGVDISTETINHASRKYKKANLEFKQGNAISIPLADSSIDVIISFETLEHFSEHIMFMKEVKRILKEDGILVISTPDKQNYSQKTGYENEFHEKELSFFEFQDLVKEYFKFSKFYSQNFFRGSLIQPMEEKIETLRVFEGDFEQIDEYERLIPLFNICVASDYQIHFPNGSLFNGSYFAKKMAELEIARQIGKIKSSLRFRLGNFFVSPISRVLKLFKA